MINYPASQSLYDAQYRALLQCCSKGEEVWNFYSLLSESKWSIFLFKVSYANLIENKYTSNHSSGEI